MPIQQFLFTRTPALCFLHRHFTDAISVTNLNGQSQSVKAVTEDHTHIHTLQVIQKEQLHRDRKGAAAMTPGAPVGQC